MKKKTVLIVAAVLIMVAVLTVPTFLKKGESVVFKTTGVIEGREVNVSSTIPGRISKKCSREGDTVEEGQVVVELENEELKAMVEQASATVEKARADIRVFASAVQSSRANIAATDADIESTVAGMEKARATMEEKKRELDRQESLYKKRISAQSSYDMALTGYEEAAADYRSSKARLVSSRAKKEAATAQLETAESRLQASEAALRVTEANLSVYRAKLDQTVIKSPISGTVVFNALESGEWASPGGTIFTIVDMEHLYATIAVEESVINRISLHQPASLHTDNSPDTVFKRKISEIGCYAEFAAQKDVNRGRQDIKTFKVKIVVDDTSGRLKPGMTVEVEVPLQNGKSEDEHN